MSQDNKVIGYLTPAEMAALMRETGMITVLESGLADGKPVIHAALKVVNAQTGEQLPGGLPFSVVMFKNPREPGYSNIAIGTIVPTAELNVSLPRDYFNFCNQRFRFTRVFPIDERSFVLQMDLFARNATREYVKYSFGVWAALFSQVLFELIGRGRESLVAAAEAYAARTDLTEQYVSTVTASDQGAVEETAVESAPDAETESATSEPEVPVGDPAAEAVATAEMKSEEAEPPIETPASVPEEPVAEAAVVVAAEPVSETAKEEPVAEAVVETAPEAANESAEPVETKEPVAA
jgi:hypothetical protein